MRHESQSRDGAWPGTRWTLLLRAARGESSAPECGRAWEELLALYRVPVAELVRRRLGVADALTIDTTVGEFFGYLYAYNFIPGPRAKAADGRLLERPYLKHRRLRAWIQTTFKYWWLGRRRDEKDPNARSLASLEGEVTSLDGDDGYAAWETADEPTNVRIWAIGARDAALSALRDHDPKAAALLERVHGFGGGARETQSAIAKKEGMAEATLSRRMRAATDLLYRCVRSELADLAGADADAAGDDMEVQVLERALRREHPDLFAESG